MSFSAHQFPHLYKSLGIDINRLGVVMLSFGPHASLVDPSMGLHANDLYASPHPDRTWLGGEPATIKSHATLLYGLLPGITEADVVDVMAGWQPPTEVISSMVETFLPTFPEGDPDHQQYKTLVARLHANEQILDAHQRLSLLPHIDTFAEYKPHVTLAYVKASQADQWEWALDGRTHRFTLDTSVDERGLMGAFFKTPLSDKEHSATIGDHR